MSEHKDYISRADELGNIHIAEEGLAAVAAAASAHTRQFNAELTQNTADLILMAIHSMI